VIDCWAKSGEGTLGARKAESLLQEMQELREKYKDESMAPDLVTFNCLLNAWALSGTRCCGYKAENYLNQMWALYNAGDNNLVKPNEKTYNTVRCKSSQASHRNTLDLNSMLSVDRLSMLFPKARTKQRLSVP
jgi:hypothetical protein